LQAPSAALAPREYGNQADVASDPPFGAKYASITVERASGADTLKEEDNWNFRA
jgi:hypothetical protein